MECHADLQTFGVAVVSAAAALAAAVSAADQFVAQPQDAAAVVAVDSAAAAASAACGAWLLASWRLKPVPRLRRNVDVLFPMSKAANQKHQRPVPLSALVCVAAMTAAVAARL